MNPAKPAHAIDCHAHVFSADAPAIAGARYRPDYGATLDAWRAQWPRAGITHGVLVQPSFFGADNREMLAALTQDANHLRGVAVVAPDVGEDELRAMHRAGVRAVRLNLQSAGDYAAFGAAPWPSLFDRIAKLGWHVETFVEAGRAPELAAALGRTRIGLVFDHFANPGADAHASFEALRGLARDRSVYVKLSGPYRIGGADPRDLARRWIDALGADRVVWGSDWPWTRHEAGHDYARMRAELDAWIGAELAPAALWDNAARLYGF
jgi:predicted TIM-barrel fold metal-dependent hydrolase